MSPSPWRRSTIAALLGVQLAVTGFAVTLAVGPAAAARSATQTDGACATPDGITVVVDFTELGGQVMTRCAEQAATGTDALRSAGFADTRDASGLICAIDDAPDPCPETFTGSYWSYWSAESGGEWQMWLEGPDAATPAAGSVEGWRYNDGSTGPGIAPPESGDDPAAVPQDGHEPTMPDDAAAVSAADAATSPIWPYLAVAVVVAAVVVAAVVRVVRRQHSPGGDS